ncbi:MAG: membrane protein insertase YidC [Alphaproteobacteria bacterium]|nr:membrane protein insertase YidC [Alphaproteobacteria bacterium]
MKDTQRLILFVIFTFSLMMLWEQWQKENRPVAPQPQSTQTSPGTPAAGNGTTAQVPMPSAAISTAKSAVAVPATVDASGNAAATQQRSRIKVFTDQFSAEIDPVGGELSYLELLTQRDTGDRNRNFVLLGPEHRYSGQSGLIGEGLPNHTNLFTAAKAEYRLEDGKDTLEVRLDAAPVAGAVAQVSKVLVFQRGSHVVRQRFDIRNTGNAALSTHAYYQLARDGRPGPGDNAMMSTYTGAAVYNDKEKFVKVAFSDIDKNKTPYSKSTTDGWIGMVQHYFVAAILPPENAVREFYTRKLSENVYTAGVILPVVDIAPGASVSIAADLYAGPQYQDVLQKLAPGLDLVVDYGFLIMLAAPLFWVLQTFHGFVGNWGVAIILLTVLLKLIFFPLSAASYRSMAKMKLVTPRLTKLREQYGNDRMKMNQAMMELYKQEKINPLGGCLPILVQIPVFIALYWVLLAAVELRHAPFYGWITDLASPETLFTIPGIAMPVGVLPIAMMLSMIVQTKMNPAPPDPVQAKVMMIMPFAFGIMFFWFPAGLVLYWFVNNLLSIAQQWQITRMIESAKPATPRR